MIRITWPQKLFLFAILLALIPVIIASWNMIGITEEELKSNTNSELVATTNELAREINDIYKNDWLSKLFMIKSGIENEFLGADEKTSFLAAGIENVEDFISLTLFFEVQPGKFDIALQTTKKLFEEAIKLFPHLNQDLIIVTSAEVDLINSNNKSIGKRVFVPELDTWLISMILPIKIQGAPSAILGARISLNRLKERITNHPFTKSGRIRVINIDGIDIFDVDQKDLSNFKVVNDVKELLKSNMRAKGTTNYVKPDGETVVAVYSFPLNLEWSVIAEIDEQKAYMAVEKMQNSLLLWVLIASGIAIFGVLIFSRQISKPIFKIGKVAEEISGGNFDPEFDYKADDSIGLVGNSLVNMGQSLKESFEQIEKQNRELEAYSKNLEGKVSERTLELKNYNEELQKAYGRLIELNIEQSEILGIAAHDLKNPLAIISGFANLIVEDAEMKRTEIDEFARLIVSASQNMFTLIRNLLDVNALEEGRVSFNVEKVDVFTVIKSVVQLNLKLAEKKNIKINIQTTDEKFDIETDKNYLAQIIDNLISNAIKFSPKGKNIDIISQQTDESLRIGIKDEGPGLTDEDKSKLFEKFMRLSAKPTADEHSTGLGLSIVKKLADLMNIKIWYHSEYGKGATFFIEIPFVGVELV